MSFGSASYEYGHSGRISRRIALHGSCQVMGTLDVIRMTIGSVMDYGLVG